MILAPALAVLLAAAAPSPATTATPAPGAPAAPKRVATPAPRDADRPVLSGFDPPTGKRFSGRFANTPLDEALTKVAEAGGLSIVLPPGTRGAVSASFRDAPVEDVLRVLLRQNGLTAAREGGIVTVSRARGGSVVIRGGKQRIEVDVDRIEREAEAAARQAEAGADKAADKAADEAADKAADEAVDGAVDGAAGGGRRRRGGNNDVLSGDQVVPANRAMGEMVVLRGNVRLEPGASAQRVTAVGGSVDLGAGATVENEVVSVGGDVHLSPGARIGGDAVSVGGRIVIDPGAEIEGERTSVNVPGLGAILGLVGAEPWRAGEGPTSRLFSAGMTLLWFTTFFVLALLAVVAVPRRVDAVAAALGNAPVKTLLSGLLGSIAVPVLALLLVVTVIGIPLVAVEVLAVVVGGLLGFTAIVLFVGRALPLPFAARGGAVVQLAIGTLVLLLVTRVPVLGALVWTAGWLVAFGAVLRTRFGQTPPAPPPEAVLPTTPVQPPPLAPR